MNTFQRYNRHTPRGKYALERGIARAKYGMVKLMRAHNATPALVALFIQQQQGAISMNLSWMVEAQAHDGTFAAAVYHILCD